MHTTCSCDRASCRYMRYHRHYVDLCFTTHVLWSSATLASREYYDVVIMHSQSCLTGAGHYCINCTVCIHNLQIRSAYVLNIDIEY